jgi:uncharacterized protein YndB with AHSA1/START domain
MNAEDESIRIHRVFEAPAALVYRQWTEPDNIKGWFAPDGYTCTRSEVDARVGGAWRVDYRSERGDAHTESGKFIELVEHSRLVFTLTQRDTQGHVGPETNVTVTLTPLGAKTEMSFVQTGYRDAKQRGGNADGWNECFGKLAQQLSAAPERELYALFEAWFKASEEKDLEASMQPIANDILSYEHEGPLQVRGIEPVREQCKQGLDAAEGNFRWDIPDLQVLVRGDIAVTWGLNRMRSSSAEFWSRGTRVFQKRSGQWKLIHQHVSYPADAETQQARVDLKPQGAEQR